MKERQAIPDLDAGPWWQCAEGKAALGLWAASIFLLLASLILLWWTGPL